MVGNYGMGLQSTDIATGHYRGDVPTIPHRAVQSLIFLLIQDGEIRLQFKAGPFNPQLLAEVFILVPLRMPLR